MNALLERPPGPPNLSDLPARVLNSRYQWERWRGVLFSLIAGLAGTLAALWAIHPTRRPPEHWRILAIAWAAGILATAAAAALLRRFAPASVLDTARRLDRHAGARNRFEAAAATRDTASPLAQAQLEDTADYLSRASPSIRPTRALPWVAAAVIALVIAHLSTLGVWTIPPLLHRLSQAPEAPAAEDFPKASITWKFPEPEIQANPVEEVPTVALVASSTGLRDLTLEISVNGAPKKSVPVPPDPFGRAGTNPLKESLYMDELEVEPFDVVSYYVRGRRITSQNVPDTASPIQFVQIRPFRDDVKQVKDIPGTRNFNLLVQLKLAQLRSVKENFVLATTDLPPTHPIRVKENDRVGKNEAALSAKTEEVAQAFIQEGYSADIIDLLRQAEPLMDDASKKILATQNQAALPSQEKALNLLVEVEKFFQKAVSDKSPAQPDNAPPDPFTDRQRHDMAKRETSPAGKLEQLADDQARLSDELSHPASPDGETPPAAPQAESSGAGSGTPQSHPPAAPAPHPPKTDGSPAQPGADADKGTPSDRQARALQGIKDLLHSSGALPPASEQALRAAQKQAEEAMRQLNQGDEEGAREPAASAAQALRTAVSEMDKEGRKETQQSLAEGQQELNDLDRQLRDLAGDGSPDVKKSLADLAREAGATRKRIEDAADKQSESGSADGAARLESLVDAMAKGGVQSDLEKMATGGLDKTEAADDSRKLRDLAAEAAREALPGKPTAEDIGFLLHALEASRANLARLAQKPGGSEGTPSGKDGDLHGANPGAAAAGTSPGGTRADADDRGARDYRETVADLVDEIQRVSAVVPAADTAELEQALTAIGRGAPHGPTWRGYGSAYQQVSAPLDKAIRELEEALEQARRQEVIRQPNLDEAPSAYRPSVSDYFESMSRGYRPDAPEGPEKP